MHEIEIQTNYDDWVRVALNGEVIFSGHSIEYNDWKSILAKIGVKVYVTAGEFDDEETFRAL